MSQSSSFIQNTNYLARNIHLLKQGEELLTPEAVRALTQALDAPLDDIIEDIKKGVSDRGRRKLDISTAGNYTRDPSSVEYSSISVTGPDPSFVVRHEFAPSHKPRDILNAVRGAIEAYNVVAVAQETTLISDYVTKLELSACEEGGHGWLVRITDATDDDSLLDWTQLTNIELHVAEDSLTSAVAPSINYYWHKTTSSFLLSTSAVELLSQAVRRTTQQAHEALMSAQASAHSAAESEASRQASESAQAASEYAQGKSEEAQGLAESAQEAAEAAQSSAEGAQSMAEQAATNSEASRQASETAASESLQSSQNASSAADAAAQAEHGSQTAQGLSEQARDAAVIAQGEAEDAASASALSAQTSADSAGIATSKAGEASSSAEDAAESERVAKQAATTASTKADEASQSAQAAAQSATQAEETLGDKVDKVEGKQLSDENYTLAEKDKLDGIAEQATKNRDDNENADKVHAHTAEQVEGLGTAATRDVGTSDGQVPEFVSGGDGLGGFGYGRVGTPIGRYADVNDTPKRTGFYLLTEGHPNSTNNKAPAAGFYDTCIIRTLRQGTNEFVDVYLPHPSYSPGMVIAPHTPGGYAAQRIVSDSINLRTTTGNSTVYPMSQKAVTDAINARGFADASGVLTATSGALSNDMSSFLSTLTFAEMRSKLDVISKQSVQALDPDTATLPDLIRALQAP